jgi:hypothetical protein
MLPLLLYCAIRTIFPVFYLSRANAHDDLAQQGVKIRLHFRGKRSEAYKISVTYLLRENSETTLAATAAFSVSWCSVGIASLTLSPI